MRRGFRRFGMGLAVGAVALGGALVMVGVGQAALLIGTSGNDVLIGKDDDRNDVEAIQPPGTMADQSLSRTDVLLGLEGDDLLIGLLGNDVLDGGAGDDVLVGGTEQATAPNQDPQFGGDGNDVSVWAGGDGSELFVGGNGIDALVFATIDRDTTTNVPTVRMVDGPHGQRGIVTSNLTGARGFCQIDPAPEGSGYEWLVRFVVRMTGAIAVTVRTQSVEQVFCSSREGNGAVWADLTSYDGGDLRPITLERIGQVNPLVGAMVR